MKAILFHSYGAPNVLQLEDVEKPTPKDDEVLIKVHAAATNPLDWHRMRAAPFIVRFGDGFQKPKNPKLGADVAGVVESVGANVTRFKAGDAVYGDCGDYGAFAEYVCTSEKKLVLKPDNVSFEGAASVPVVGFTALQGLRDKGQIQAGQRVLVNGASGGIGTIAVQIAKSYETEVTGVCSTRNLELVHSIGADHVIDYTQRDFTRNGQQYDLIFDTIGNLTATGIARALSPSGIGSIAGFTTLPHMFQTIAQGMWFSMTGDKSIGLMDIAKTNLDDLQILTELLETGKVKPVIDRCYPLEQTAEAIAYLETGRARGKVIITIAE